MEHRTLYANLLILRTSNAATYACISRQTMYGKEYFIPDVWI